MTSGGRVTTYKYTCKLTVRDEDKKIQCYQFQRMKGNIKQVLTREQENWCTFLYTNAGRPKKYDGRNAISSCK